MNPYKKNKAYSIIAIFTIQYWKHCYIFKKSLMMLGWYAVSPMMRERGTLYGNVDLWKQSFKTVKKSNTFTLYQISSTMCLCKDRWRNSIRLVHNVLHNEHLGNDDNDIKRSHTVFLYSFRFPCKDIPHIHNRKFINCTAWLFTIH